MKIVVDTHLRIAQADMSGKGIASLIVNALQIPNAAKDTARREHVYGWQEMPDEIVLWAYDASNNSWVLPRGYAAELFSDLDSMGIKFEIIDHRLKVYSADHMLMLPVGVRDDQDEMVKHMLKVEQGVLEAPPGSGKTVASLELIRRSEQRSLVIVDKTNIAAQWKERAEWFLGYEPGLIGDGAFVIKDFTVALVQTLWAKQDMLRDSGFFDQWGLVLLDECHHAPARTFSETMQLFPAHYRFGVSATPERREGLWVEVEAAIGPLIHKVTKGDLRSLGVLVSPKVVVHSTGFNRDYFPTHKYVNDQVCDRMGCTRARHKKLHRNNYTDIVGELATDEDRNNVIRNNIVNDFWDGRHVLVVSSRKSQLRELKVQVGLMLGNDSDLYMLTGDQSTEERMEVANAAENGPCVIFSTIADEALDIPRLDSLHLVWPTRNTQKIRQQLGRVERVHPAKKDAIVHDYADDVGPLRGQLSERFAQVYVKEGLDTQVPAWLRRP